MGGMTFCFLSQNGRSEGALVIISRVQLLIVGLFLYRNHPHHGVTTFLRFLIQDKPEVGEQLTFVVQVSSPRIPQ